MDTRQMIREQRIVIGRNIARQVISGIMQREMRFPGIIIFAIAITHVNPRKMHCLLASFTIRKNIPKRAMEQERAAIVKFALWQFM
jgi:hypothetical protein